MESNLLREQGVVPMTVEEAAERAKSGTLRPPEMKVSVVSNGWPAQPLAPPPPPDLVVKVAAALRAEAGYEGNGGLLDDCDYYARQAETALRAADVPGLLALQATSNLFIQAVGRAASDTGWRKDDDETPGIADWIRLVAAERDRLLAEIEQLRTEQADNLRAAQSIAAELVAQRDEARKALAECEDKLDDIINCMGGDDCSGWDAPEDVWEMAQKGRTIARRVLGKEAERES